MNPKRFKAAQYYASPNQMVATNTSMTPNTGVKYRELQAYRPEVSIQCCHGNVHRFLPNYVCRMWMSGAHGGIAAVLYGPSKVQTVAGSENIPVTIQEQTDYPFDGKITLKIEADQPVKFPLYLRIPGWAEGATLSVNGEPVAATPVPGTFFKLERTFAAGDVVTVNFPMKVRMENPVANGVSLLRGPLLYALKIKVDAKVSSVKTKSTRKQDPNFPSWDLTPASPWNYALELKGPEDLDKVKVTAKPVDDFPWTPEGSPVALTVPARKVPAWVLSEGKTKDGTIVPANPPLPQPPLELAAETEQVTLVPEGATQLRVSVFPAMGTSGSPQNSPR